MSYSSCSCFCLLDRIIQICVFCFRAVKIWCFEYNSLILTTGCSTWHLLAKNSLRIWELELLLSTKMAEVISCSVTAWNWVPYSGQGHTEVFQDGFHSEQASQGSIKEVESLCCASGAEAGFKKHRCMSAASIALEVAEVEGQLVSAQTIRHTLQQVGLHGRHPRRKPLLKLAHKKACK